MFAVARGDDQRLTRSARALVPEEDRGMTTKAMMATAPSVNELERLHRELDVEVTRLERRAYLTPNEQRLMTDLKKEKLWAKDQIATLRKS
jgi:hypothetical protein